MDRAGMLLSLWTIAFCLQAAKGQLRFYWLYDVDYHGLTHEEKRLFIELHNEARSGVSAAGMPFLRWVPDLELVAINVANTCSVTLDGIHLGYGYLMHNGVEMFPSTNWFGSVPYVVDNDTVRTVMDDWLSPGTDYDIDTNTCSSGDCSSYLQIVNSSSIYFGCAYVSCARMYQDYQLIADNSPYFFVCVYEGDVRKEAVTPGAPYVKLDTPCIDCPVGYSACSNGLCRTEPDYCNGDVQQYCYGDALVNTDYCDCDCPAGEDHMDVYCRPNVTTIWNEITPFEFINLAGSGLTGRRGAQQGGAAQAKSSILITAVLLTAARFMIQI